jgi:uncharacterized protein (TIGR03067 family)
MTFLTPWPSVLRFALASKRPLAGPPPGDPLQGNWRIISAERTGHPAKDLDGHRLTFAGNTFAIVSSSGELLYRGTWTADASTNPARIDLRHETETLRGRTWKGIYTRNQNALIISANGLDLAKDRPTRFATTPDSASVSVHCERTRWG